MSVDEAISAALDVQKSWVDSLCAGDEGTALSLRIANTPMDHGWGLRLGFIGRVQAGAEDVARNRALDHWHAFRAAFPDADYPIVAAESLEEFTGLFLPFYPNEISEVRRGEEIATLVEAYLPSPYSQSSRSDMQSLCRALLAAHCAHLVAINIAPTRLKNEERTMLATEARRFGELKQRSVQTSVQSIGYGVTVQKLLGEADIAESTYLRLASSLSHAFEMTCVVAAEKSISDGILRCLAAEAVREDVREQTDRQTLAPRAVVARPANLGERLAAFKNLLELRTDFWGGQLAPQALERLSKIFATRQVHSLFRLPIPDEDGVYGIPCSAFGGTIEGGRRRQFRTTAKETARSDEISLGPVSIARDRLTEHLFVSGVPGTGKTNTCLFLLNSLWEDGDRQIPFMVLEPAKFEYRNLIRTPSVADDLLVFTAGDERVAPLRFNPFAVPPAISLEAHVGRLIDIFRASMSMWGPLPAILEKLIRRLYRRKGWQYVAANLQCEPPQMSELYESIGPGIRELGYSRETESEATAALEVRIARLCEGSLGKMLNTRLSIDFDELMTRPVVIEIASIGNTDDRAFIMALLLNRLYEYWICRKEEANGVLKHVTLVEEAHNLLANVSTAQIEGQANPKGEAVAQFANMLAEIRSFGEGLIIADQSPSKLIPEVVRMTGAKITHALVADEDRRVLKSSMNLTDEQAYQLALLPVGHAVLFQTASKGSTEIVVPPFRSSRQSGRNLSDAEVREFGTGFRNERPEIFLPTPGCIHCPTQCQYDELTESALLLLGHEGERHLKQTLSNWWLGVIADDPSPPPYEAFTRALQRVQRKGFNAAAQRERAFCAMTKASYRFLRETGETQFIPSESTDELHKLVAESLTQNGEWLKSLRQAAIEAAAPPDALPPFDACVNCRMQCLLRGVALSLIPDYSGHNAENVTTQSLADRAWEITARTAAERNTPQLEPDLTYCVAVQLTERSANVSWEGLFDLVNRGKPKFSGCRHCPQRCRFGEPVEAAVREIVATDEQVLARTWNDRFGKSKQDIVAELAGVFHQYAKRIAGHETANPADQSVMAFCVSLHARALSPILSDAGAKARNPHEWWGDVMVEGLKVNH